MSTGINGQYFYGFEDLDLGDNELTAGSIKQASGTLALKIADRTIISITDSLVTFNEALTMANNQHIFIPDNTGLYLGTSQDSRLQWSTQQTNDSVVWGLGNGSLSLILCRLGWYDKDYDHPNQSNPTLFVQSINNPDTANDEWISITHDATDGVIDCGSGTLNLGGTANVNFAGATRTAATVTHDAYVTLEIGGVAYKFMLGS